MPKTSAARTAIDDEFEAEVAAEAARIEQTNGDSRAVAYRRVAHRRHQQGILDRAADIGFWEKDLARHGCRPVVAAWPDCPVPPIASASFAPTERMPQLKAPRPVIYNAGLYRLDDQGIWLHRAGYWICSPVFQTARGVDDTRPSLYAVQVDGKWKTVQVDPRQAAHNDGVVRSALTGAGLRLNPQPVHHDALLNAVPANGYRDHFIISAREKLDAFLEDHRRELPVRS